MSRNEGWIAAFAAPPHGPGDGVGATMFTRMYDEPTAVLPSDILTHISV